MNDHAARTRKQITGSSSSTTGTTSDGSCEASSTTAYAASADKDDSVAIDAIRFDALRNATYHSLKADRASLWHKLLMLAVILSGTAGVGNFAETFLNVKQWAAVTAVIGRSIWCST